MKRKHRRSESTACSADTSYFDRRLAAYLAAAASGSLLASEAQAVVVSNSSVQPVGINGAIAIDFNSDGQTDFEIDHDRVDLGGGNILDYLQLDKNDINGAPPAEDPLPVNFEDTFPLNGTVANENAQAAYVTPDTGLRHYPAALTAGTPIGPGLPLDFQEGDNFNSTNDH